MSTSPPPHRRILIGEDTADIAYLIQRTLEYAGYSAETTGDGLACLDRARATLPDLVVLDINMPKMHGIDVLRNLQADPATKKIGVLICTAKDFKAELDQCLELGAADVLLKPFEAVQLIAKVDAYFKKESGAEAGGGGLVEVSEEPAELYAPQLETTRGQFHIWGTRGSTPTPGGRFVRHGGHTSCMSVTFGDDHFIFDAGSGIRELGLELMKGEPRRLHLFITHTHWDHIQGFPFFTPAYMPGYEIIIYGAEGFRKDLKSVFRGQLDSEYFPVQLEAMKADITFRTLPPEPMEVGAAKVTWEFSQHPGATVGYKIEVADKRIAWVPDNEFLQGYLGDPAELTRDHRLVVPFTKMIEFLSDADIVIHEAQYTNEEYVRNVGWGHSSVSNAALLMKLAKVPRWLVTHHDPNHDDGFLENKLNVTRQILERLGHPIRMNHGYDGLTNYF